MRKRTQRNRFVWMVALLFVLLPVLGAQEAGPLPIDSKVRYGKLDNGLTYYIRHNELPKGRADFYIVHNVGSVLEEENQRGLAHFLEHMAFDGSKHFPNDGMDHYIESVGMRGGENFNAYTSFDETVYMVMNAPVDKPAVTDSCLLILHDWTGFLSLTDSAIAKERGVIREEWRTRQDAQARLWEQQLPKMYPGSRYANRMPIGTIEVIENFKPDELRAYYHKWYRPDQQAIIVVGDVDMAEVERKVREMFGDIPAPVNPAERKEAEVPDNEEPLVSVATDKEAANTVLFLFYKHDNLPKERRATIEGAVHNYIQSICASVMAERFDAIVHQPNPPFIYAEGYDSDNYMVARTKGAWTTAAMVKDNAVDSALFALVRENERARQFGFTKGEYDRAKANVLKSYESAYNEREKQPNSAYSREYLSHFTEGGYIPGIEMEYELMRQIAQELPLEAVNQYVAQVISERNIVISLTGPDKAGVTYPTEAELLAMFEKARRQPVEPYRETVSNEPLIPALPAPGKIAKSEAGLLGSTVLTLGNGVRVVLKPTTLKRDQVLLSASSPGGSSLYGPDEIVNLKVFNDVIELFGGKAIDFLSNTKTFPWVVLISDAWKEMGWSAIIFIAALMGIDVSLFEAAMVEGANSWQRVRYITLPAIAPVIVTVLILKLGTILDAGFNQIFMLYSPQVYSVADIIDTWVYRQGLLEFEFGLATAVGLFKGVFGMILVLFANWISKKVTESALF